MKIKHFQGYGSVNATKVSKKTFTNEYGEKKTRLVVMVQGTHEYGLKVNDVYDGVRWLLSRFEKNIPDEMWRVEMSAEYDQAKTSNGYEDVCIYTFTY